MQSDLVASEATVSSWDFAPGPSVFWELCPVSPPSYSLIFLPHSSVASFHWSPKVHAAQWFCPCVSRSCTESRLTRIESSKIDGVSLLRLSHAGPCGSCLTLSDFSPAPLGSQLPRQTEEPASDGPLVQTQVSPALARGQQQRHQ